jgi:hypothetical protein
MRLTARLATLERHKAGTPALVKQWVDMLTRLSASIAESDAAHTDDDATSPTMLDPAGIREEAERHAATGSPATISDLFRLVREAKGEE